METARALGREARLQRDHHRPRRRGLGLPLRPALLLPGDLCRGRADLDPPGPEAAQLRAALRVAAGLYPLRARGDRDRVRGMEGLSVAVPGAGDGPPDA